MNDYMYIYINIYIYIYICMYIVNNVVRFMGHCIGIGGVISLVESRCKVPKAPTILRYLKPENS